MIKNDKKPPKKMNKTNNIHYMRFKNMLVELKFQKKQKNNLNGSKNSHNNKIVQRQALKPITFRSSRF